jgi:pimeloyl-ACP methyl ester carboxylesterase
MNKTAATLHVGDALNVLATLPDGHADCIVTSPPYWAKRDYGVTGQYGHEPDPDTYVGMSISLLGQDLAAAAVAIDPAPIKGVRSLPVSAQRVASIALRKPANRNLAVSLTAEQFRYGFGNALSEQESAELHDRWTVPSPGKPLFEAALANFTPRSPAKVNTANKTRGPLLLTAGGKDHTVPAAITTSTRKLYHRSPAVTDFVEFPDRGHSLTIDHGWREVAQAALDWLSQRHSEPGQDQ